jgi:NADP-dependent 3-hydroxy acid dehydrogenase YdfG
MEDLVGRVAIVTGAASGIGRAIADRFAAEGMAVVMADIESEALKKAGAEVRARGAEVLTHEVDVTDAAAVVGLADAAKARFGTFHVACNNAGVIGAFTRVWETPLEDWRWTFDVNVMGVVHGLRAFVPTLFEQNLGHVVNTASLGGWSSGPAMGAYCASKHAVLSISDGLRAELDAAGSAVAVSVLCPGFVNSNLLNASRNWLPRLGDHDDSAGADPVSTAMADMLVKGTTGEGMDPSRAADAVVRAIKENRFVISSHPEDVISSAQRRLQQAHEGCDGLFS